MIAELSNGDARVALDTLGSCGKYPMGEKITVALVGEAMQSKVSFYDGREDKYNLLSARRSRSGAVIRTRRFTIWPALWKAAQIRRPSEEGFWSCASEDVGMAFPPGGQPCHSLCPGRSDDRISRGADQSWRRRLYFCLPVPNQIPVLRRSTAPSEI